MIIIKHPLHTKGAKSGKRYSSGDPPDTLDPQFFVRMVRRRDQYFDSHFRSDCWTRAAEDQGSIQCNITRETSRGALYSVIPVENHWKSQLVSNSGPPLHVAFESWAEMHRLIRDYVATGCYAIRRMSQNCLRRSAYLKHLFH